MKKNIVIILCDQLRKDSLGCYGNTVCETPNIDALAEESTVFNRCYVANPICMPNRMSIFTGMYPRNHGLWTNGLLIRENPNNLGCFLTQNGYQTASIGKIHFEPYGADEDSGSRESTKRWENDQYAFTGPYWGFQEIQLTLGHTRLLSHYKDWVLHSGGYEEDFKKGESKENQVTYLTNIPIKHHSSTFIGDKCEEYIVKNSKNDKPFVMVASFPHPHHPFDPPKEFVDNREKKDEDYPIGSQEDLATRPKHYEQHYKNLWSRGEVKTEDKAIYIDEEEAKLRRNYTYAMIELIDNNVGRIIQALKDNSLYEDTIIVFTTDHGELLGDHGLWYKGPFFYEGLINVPLIIKNGHNKGMNDNLVSSIDIFPTLCDMVHVRAPYYVDGISQLQNIEEGIPCREYCLTEYRNGYGTMDCPSMTLTTKQYKYTRNANIEEELTDLTNDPNESKNVVNCESYSEIRDRMRMKMLDVLIERQQKSPEQLSHA